jgi:type I restriction enzyme M protein
MNKVENMKEWIKKRYIEMLDFFKDKEFRYKEAASFLKERFKDSEDQVKNILSEFKKSDVLEIKKDENDKREKIYRLKSVFEISGNKDSLGINSKDELINLLKQAADLIRTRVDYTFILLLLFYKAMSDKWEKEFEEVKENLIKKGWEVNDAVEEAKTDVYHTFNFPEDCRWDNLRKDSEKISEKFSRAMKKLAEVNPQYQDIFSQFDFYQFISSRENSIVLNQLVELFSKFSFKNVSMDILGDAYEWTLKYFAPSKAKEGEVYTAREVIRLMVEILEPKPKESIYDPGLGSCGMLIGAYNYLSEKYGKEKADTLFLYGQEINLKTLALAKMNMILHGISNYHIESGDTLLFPRFKENDNVKQFDCVIANPPWNQDGYDEETLKKAEFWQKRFTYGFPPSQSADWAWIEHMIVSSKNKVVVVIDTGAVSRGGKEKIIRQKIVEDDLIESVILLPEKLFYNTGAPAVIIVFNKNKPEKRKKKILLINASKEYQEGKKQNTLSKENIQKIVTAYHEFKDIEKFTKVITLEEAKEVDYNLSPSRFVSVIDEEEYRNINEIKVDLYKLENERKKIEEKVKKILEKI